MKPLQMYLRNTRPLCETVLPEGYQLCAYRNEKDVDAWLECVRGSGLMDACDSRDVFVNTILRHKALQLYEDLLFLLHNGAVVGTVAAVLHDNGGGEVFMLTVKQEERGQGLGRLLLLAALQRLSKAGFVTLCLPEQPLAAAGLFLRVGFLPVDNGADAQERWIDLLSALGIDSSALLTAQGQPSATLYRLPPEPRRRVRVGVFGIDRGAHMMRFCLNFPDTELVALCDTYEPTITRVLGEMDCSGATLYASFDEFIKHPMDAVVLTNYATEHAPYAIRCLKAGLHVFSEVLPAETLAEAARLADAAEQSGCVYAYGENYCYMPAPRTMRRLVRQGVLGDFAYGEGEYMHNTEPIYHNIIQHNPQHWRNRVDAFFYCTHSVGPMLHAVGLRPVRVSGFSLPYNEKCRRMGMRAQPMAMEIITLENGALLKSIHGGAVSRSSIWYSLYGTLGRMESAREDAGNDGVNTLYVNCGDDRGDGEGAVFFPTADRLNAQAELAGHGGSDFYVMYNFIRRVQGDRNADVIGIYEALDMFLVGRFAQLSAQAGGSPMEIPDFRKKEVRDRYRADPALTCIFE